MATVREYIAAKLDRYYIELDSADLDGMLVEADLSGSDEYTAESSTKVKRALAAFIPELLLAPESITQGGFTIKRNFSGLREYYAKLCDDLGIPNNATTVPRIKNMSNIW